VTSGRVSFRTEAIEQLEELHDYIAGTGSTSNAANFTDAILAFCETLADFPLLGASRDDIRPGLRTIGFRRRVVVAFAILGEAVTIVGIFYGGRDHDSLLAAGDDFSP
jgi:toxin ParE1/3/4